MPPLLRLLYPLAILTGSVFVQGQAAAEVRVQLDGSMVAIRVDGGRVADVMKALGENCPVRVRSLVPLDKPIQGAFSGPLSQALSWALDGFDYVSKSQPGRLDVLVVGIRGDAPVVARQPEPPAAPGPATQWRGGRGPAAPGTAH